ncbi:DNA-directed RNA polymerase II subunit rpb1 [Colletotrichum fructicola]|uniref:DNA-directed RNA polymerase subunit n=1 Tax=Colletotrichum fructicola (strain Nara gc5) TaxID=1213859 RepID=L2FJ99_COLFN|nr:DNA-directed RNA polymerase II subunit RPB1 [Colletotrichum fructicola]KAF4479046.1 DNA-directed RNA polymerase II subunit rpb1 [Colletotrichum fructicola Nara gc5]KAE9580997.1 DNA-directed RNA polymerase II subunit [Colletotrichum fructicola]KAF4422252.1 DNA-directed RNA polymerase II subunit rpb1 [Colletotrichum fructicola]KAF4898028.1 DNA-directed RNA polymerase II subunit rpb1 [Colletotrichum fructicola]KAF4909408.1 DNA-directed RNA polymerase II subunit rpb1 [Colletotrichum fructicola]
MANLYFTHSSAPIKTVEEIQFGLMAPEEIKNMSVCHVLYPETMDETRTKPRDGGLNDPMLGSIDRQFKCKTCNQAMGECPGHFGHIELAKPVYHPGFIKKVKKVLEIVCHNCSKVLADRSDPEFLQAVNTRDPKVRFNRIWNICKKKTRCENETKEVKNDDGEYSLGMKQAPVNHGGCGNIQPRVRHKALQLIAKYESSGEDGVKKKEEPQITPEMAHNILRRISDDDLRDMGLNLEYARPEWMIVTVLPVPPPPVRPSISMDGTGQGLRNEDDLTYKLGDIIRANSNVKQAIREGSPAHIAQDFEQLLQYHVATYMDNDIAGQPRALQKSGRPVKAIRARLKGKEGRLRGNLMGKRVDFSARTVITGDANLSLDEVGVPRSIARTLTYPETVTPYNIGRLHELVQNGPNEHPGAKYVIRSDGTRIDLRHHRRAGQISLEYGWKVERHLITGDYIIFNRQPSLHKESMMGHRVRVMPYSTFRLNLSVTSPYNADFDGDEMNLHVPQSEETRAEVKELCLVPINIVSPQRNGPLMGIVQDTLAGAYKLCRRDVFLTKEAVMNIMLWVPNWDGVIPPPAIIRPRPRWTGKQIMSMAIPNIVSLHNAPDSKEDNPLKDEGLLIQSGELLYGLLSKKNIGAASGGIVHIVYNEHGPEASMKFLNGVQQVVNYWLLHNGFSIGIGDTIPDKLTIEKVQVHIDEHKAEVEAYTQQATANELEPLPGMNIRETFESKVSKALNTARDKAGTTTQKSLKDLNNAVTMASSGSKGSSINISQMTALVGQQIVEGKRIPFGFKYRTLPHFTKDDYSPEARGFVENSYLRGLTPSEFFFHAMAGREGLIDTAVKTAETGYIQRRLVKALEDVSAKYDGTVRNSLGDILQFLYGEDGLDAIYIEKQRMDHLNMSDKKFADRFRLDVMDETRPDELDWLEYGNEISGDPSVQQLLDEEYEALLHDRKQVRKINFKRKDDESMQLPLNIVRLMETSKKLFAVEDFQRSDLKPQDVIPAVQAMLNRMTIVRGNDEISKEADRSATILFKAQIRSRLAFKRIACQQRLNKMAFEHVLGELEARWDRAFVSPGEMVGVIAAQSIGEPATQMTLNTFHFAGVSSKNVTLGVPRLKEILNLAQNIKTPSMVVYLSGEENASQEAAKALRSTVEHTTLRSVTAVTEIYYDPIITSTNIPDDLDMVESYYLIPDETHDRAEDQSRWLLRLTLDRQKLLDKELTVEDVARRIKEEYPNDLAVIFSDNNAEEQVIRIRPMHAGNDDKDEDGEKKMEDDVMLKRLETHLLDTLSLRGVKGIERAFLNKETKLIETEDGALLAAKADERCSEWYLDTSGTALRQVLSVDGVDSTRTYTNHLWQVVEVFGIEAARSALVRELTQVLAFDGSYVNHRHLALLCDVMTYRGTISAVTRHGINRADTGALMRCSFEETVEILLEAAAVGELDDCRGISENVMLGQMAPMGTGHFEVLLDPKMLETVISDNSRMGLMPGMPVKGGEAGGAATPYDSGSPMADSGYLSLSSPAAGNFSPIVGAGSDSPAGFEPGPANKSIQHVTDLAFQQLRIFLAVLAERGILSHFATHGRCWRSLCDFATVQPFLPVVLPDVTHAATHEPCKPQLQPDVSKLLAGFSLFAKALLAHLSSAVRLAHLAELLSCQSQLQPGISQPSRGWSHVAIILPCVADVVANFTGGVLADKPEFQPKNSWGAAVSDQPQLLPNLTFLVSENPWTRWFWKLNVCRALMRHPIVPSVRHFLLLS